MHAIHVVHLDKARPAIVLTRDSARPLLSKWTVAPITSTIRGLVSEVPLGRRNGLDHDCVASVDNVATIPAVAVGRLIGFLDEDDEHALTTALARAFDLT